MKIALGLGCDRNTPLATDLVSRHKRQEAAILNWPD